MRLNKPSILAVAAGSLLLLTLAQSEPDSIKTPTVKSVPSVADDPTTDLVSESVEHAVRASSDADTVQGQLYGAYEGTGQATLIVDRQRNVLLLFQDLEDQTQKLALIIHAAGDLPHSLERHRGHWRVTASPEHDEILLHSEGWLTIHAGGQETVLDPEAVSIRTSSLASLRFSESQLDETLRRLFMIGTDAWQDAWGDALYVAWLMSADQGVRCSDCDAGGPGASSCSIEVGELSASVICNAGYACCKYFGPDIPPGLFPLSARCCDTEPQR